MLNRLIISGDGNWPPPSMLARKLEICEIVVSCIALCKVQNRPWCLPKVSCKLERGTLHDLASFVAAKSPVRDLTYPNVVDNCNKIVFARLDT